MDNVNPAGTLEARAGSGLASEGGGAGGSSWREGKWGRQDADREDGSARSWASAAPRRGGRQGRAGLGSPGESAARTPERAEPEGADMLFREARCSEPVGSPETDQERTPVSEPNEELGPHAVGRQTTALSRTGTRSGGRKPNTEGVHRGSDALVSVFDATRCMPKP